MERKTRIWIGLGTAILVGGTAADQRAAAAGMDPSTRPDAVAAPRPAAPAYVVAQAEPGSFEGGEGGEGEGGEGGGQVLGTITEFRLSSTDPNAYQYDARPQVEAYAALVHETYAGARAAAVDMQAAITALLADPAPATLAAAREAWLAARSAYALTEPYLFYAGPVDIPGGPIKRLNAWPINPAFLDYVAGDADGGLVNDPSVPMTRAGIVRLDQADDPANVTTGWHAIEFLLWGESAGARPYTDFIAGTGNNDRRREFLRIITQLLVNDLSTLVAAWAPGTNNYRGSVVAMDQRNAIGRAFNGMAVLAGYEMALRRVAAGLPPASVERLQSRFSASTTGDHIHDLKGIRNVYFGAAGGVENAGFDTLVATIDPALNERVVAAFARAEDALSALDASGGASRPDGEAAVAALKELASALRAVGNRLGVLVLIPGV